LSTSTITSKGQITIPKAVRDALKVKEGDQVVFVFEGDRAYLYPIRRKSLTELRGVFQDRRPFPGREVERAAAHAAAAAEALRTEPKDG